jgi:hypothetical protein
LPEPSEVKIYPFEAPVAMFNEDTDTKLLKVAELVQVFGAVQVFVELNNPATEAELTDCHAALPEPSEVNTYPFTAPLVICIFCVTTVLVATKLGAVKVPVIVSPALNTIVPVDAAIFPVDMPKL